ncbi:DUF2924 domain-containing protein [Terriglobus sp. TAA 43]|uniref:DUF2924 domain-containing protein n=1 Tax=Terriglobus sp. TAA 43 TaxID=278961 RepID=UPI00068A37C7
MISTQKSDAAIADELAALPAMDKRKLLKVWDEVYQTPPHHTLRKELIVPILAYRLQEVVHGGLSNSARRKLLLLREAPRKPQKTNVTGVSSDSAGSTKLVRTWGGETHEVIVTASGFVYRGETFKKLSPIAKRITGTQWSGPAFFGTRSKDRRDA